MITAAAGETTPMDESSRLSRCSRLGSWESSQIRRLARRRRPRSHCSVLREREWKWKLKEAREMRNGMKGRVLKGHKNDVFWNGTPRLPVLLECTLNDPVLVSLSLSLFFPFWVFFYLCVNEVVYYFWKQIIYLYHFIMNAKMTHVKHPLNHGWDTDNSNKRWRVGI